MDLRVVVLSLIPLWVVFPSAVLSDPIQVDFNKCQAATYQTVPDPSVPLSTLQCCPPAPTRATKIISGLPPPSTLLPRVRLAFQCTDAAYAAKLKRAYALMRALPSDDPRSLAQQSSLHCSYCGGAFYMGNNTANSNTTGIDIHFSWLFFPWHRLYLYFHERILQSLLGDPTFSLNFWNWDNPYTVGGGGPLSPACLKVGHNFPSAYSPSTSATYDNNRSENAKGNGRLKFPDLTFSELPATSQPLYNASAETVIASNLNVMNNALVTGGTTTTSFMGRQYRAGDIRGNLSATGGGGSLEQTAHAGVHLWTGQDPPINNDMGALAFAARDPVFFAHHSNIDRLFQVWKDIGPILGQNRQYYSDPDFLNAEFEFYDENKVLRKVKVSESLDTRKMGYIYQKANDAAWINYKSTKCSTKSYAEVIAQAKKLPVPVKDATGAYHLPARGAPFVITLVQPASNGAEVFLTIDGIKLSRSVSIGFDVFVSLISPRDYPSPWNCGEYAGRFMNLASWRGRFGPKANGRMTWSQSISAVLSTVQVPQPGPSSVVVTILPTSNAAAELITFTSISIGPSSG